MFLVNVLVYGLVYRMQNINNMPWDN